VWSFWLPFWVWKVNLRACFSESFRAEGFLAWKIADSDSRPTSRKGPWIQGFHRWTFSHASNALNIYSFIEPIWVFCWMKRKFTLLRIRICLFNLIWDSGQRLNSRYWLCLHRTSRQHHRKSLVWTFGSCQQRTRWLHFIMITSQIKNTLYVQTIIFLHLFLS
jgi:hypothetical protein